MGVHLSAEPPVPQGRGLCRRGAWRRTGVAVHRTQDDLSSSVNNLAPCAVYMAEESAMSSMIFTVCEGKAGWFVQGHDRFGPFFSKQRAVDLAEGMVAALRAAGEEADMCIATHPDPTLLAPERPSFADKSDPQARAEAEDDPVRTKRDRTDQQGRQAVR